MKSIVFSFSILFISSQLLGQDFSRADYYENLESQGILTQSEVNILSGYNYSPMGSSLPLSDQIMNDLGYNGISIQSITTKGLVLDVVQWVANKLFNTGMSMDDCISVLREVVDLNCRVNQEKIEEINK